MIHEILSMASMNKSGNPGADIPTGGGGGEWKRLGRVEVTEDNVSYFLFTTDENGEAFQATDFTVRIKAVKRTSVSSFRVLNPGYRSGVFDFAMSKTIGQMNAFGNTGSERYYTMQLTGEGDWRKTFLSESNADIFSTSSNGWAAANNVYASGVTYTVGDVKYPMNEVALLATNGFFTGDILEIWYR